MAVWSDPKNGNPVHTNVLSDLNDKDTYCITMGQVDAGFTEIPENAMKFDGSAKLFRRNESGTFQPIAISLAGGGTGATTAAGAREKLMVAKTGVADSEVRTNAQNDLRYLSNDSDFSGINDKEAAFNNIKQPATTSVSGAVQLNNTLTSTSASQALTAAQGKVLKDLLDSYFQVASVSAPSGDLTSGGMKIAKSGNTVTISSDTSGAGFSHASSDFAESGVIIPVGLRPLHNVSNTYSLFIGSSYGVFVRSNGTIAFQYSKYDGTVLNRTSTGGFTISYTV